ncbi:MAG: hypothetical protein ACKOX7_05065 [Bacteroidota bacterium]
MRKMVGLVAVTVTVAVAVCGLQRREAGGGNTDLADFTDQRGFMNRQKSNPCKSVSSAQFAFIFTSRGTRIKRFNADS